MDRNTAEALYRKYLDGQCTPEEKQLLDTAFLHYLQDSEGLPTEQQLRDADGRLRTFFDSYTKPPRRLRTWRRFLPYAAAVAVLLAVGWLLVDMRRELVDTRLATEEILPGGNRATLTLADGSTVDLSSEQTGIVIGDEDVTYQDGTSLALSPAGGGTGRSEDGRWKTEDGRRKGNTSESQLRTPDFGLLTLTTPKGGTYQVTLPDGSKVWLNSASTLKYPSRFSGEERLVELTGEAYFEVRHETLDRRHETPDSAPESHLKSQISNLKSKGRPFRVVSKGQRVEVLGTQFNISAYTDDPETKTTLVEGKVQVGLSPAGGGRGRFAELKPGEQSVTRETAIEIQEVNVQQYVSWKSGYFSLQDKPLNELMKEVARWYAVEVVYEGPVPDVQFYGDANRNKDISVILHLLESAQVAYRLEGRTLIIDNKKGGN